MVSKQIKLEDLLQRNVYDVDEEPHIVVLNSEGLPKEALIRLCPAGCYTMVGGKLLFSYEGCLECGLCRVIGGSGVKWDYPKSGRGIQYRFT